MIRKFALLPGILILMLATAGSNPPPELAAYRTGLLKLFPNYQKAEKSAPFTFRLFDAAGKELGRLYVTNPKQSRTEGYGGPVEVGVATATNGKIAGVVIGKNQETSSFLARVERRKLLRRWNGLRFPDAVKKNVDTVTRATYSSGAIISGVRAIAEREIAAEKTPKQ